MNIIWSSSAIIVLGIKKKWLLCCSIHNHTRNCLWMNHQVRCTTPQYCADEGVNIVVTDYGEGDKTDFILSTRAYAKLARPNVVSQLFSYGVVDIEYRRISCKYSGYNLMFKVHENSNYPHYLSIVLLYVAGQNDITAVEFWQVCALQKEWYWKYYKSYLFIRLVNFF